MVNESTTTASNLTISASAEANTTTSVSSNNAPFCGFANQSGNKIESPECGTVTPYKYEGENIWCNPNEGCNEFACKNENDPTNFELETSSGEKCRPFCREGYHFSQSGDTIGKCVLSSGAGGNQGGNQEDNKGGNQVEPLCGFYVNGEPKFYDLNDTPTQQSGGGSFCQVGQKLCPNGCHLDGLATSCLNDNNSEACNKTFSVLSDINPNENYQCSAPSYNSSINCGSPVCYRPDNYEQCNSTCTYVAGDNSVNACYFGCGSVNQGTLQVHSDTCEKCSGSNYIDIDISSDNYGRCTNNSDSMECKPNIPESTFPCSQYGGSEQQCTSYSDCVWAAV